MAITLSITSKRSDNSKKTGGLCPQRDGIKWCVRQSKRFSEFQLSSPCRKASAGSPLAERWGRGGRQVRELAERWGRGGQTGERTGREVGEGGADR